ncbi:MAG: serine/threonine-protein kinase [Pirellulales bacterium]
MAETSDRNLLFGVLALQMDFVTREQLLAGMQDWISEKTVALADHLERKGALRADDRACSNHWSPSISSDTKTTRNEAWPRSVRSRRSRTSCARWPRTPPLDDDLLATLSHLPGEAERTTAHIAGHVSLGINTSDGTRFRILRPHAAGGLGSVYVVRDTELDREVALKEIQLDKAHDADNRTRFTREAEITGGLEHPGIVPVYGLGTYADGRPFYAMKFIRGDSLKEAIDAFHRTDAERDPGTRNLMLRKLLQRFIDVCEAIDYAHSRGVLHRDLKPGNIMLGRHGETLVVDWGLAKPLGEIPKTDRTPPRVPEATLSAPRDENPLIPRSSSDGSLPTLDGATLGTPHFMSPEQAQGRIDLLGPPADVFGLGATLYAILTGKPPYEGHNVFEVVEKAQRADYPPPRGVVGSIPRPLDAICRRAMAGQPEDRYPTAQALADDVERYLADESIAARADTLLERIGRVMRRHRGAFLAGTAAVAVIAVGAIFGAVTINAAKDQETAAKNDALAPPNASRWPNATRSPPRPRQRSRKRRRKPARTKRPPC